MKEFIIIVLLLGVLVGSFIMGMRQERINIGDKILNDPASYYSKMELYYMLNE